MTAPLLELGTALQTFQAFLSLAKLSPEIKVREVRSGRQRTQYPSIPFFSGCCKFIGTDFVIRDTDSVVLCINFVVGGTDSVVEIQFCGRRTLGGTQSDSGVHRGFFY